MTETVLTVPKTMPVSKAAELLVKKRIGSLVVVEQHKPIALLTKNDILWGAVKKQFNRVAVKDVMRTNYIVVSPQTSYAYLVKKLRNENVKWFLVKEDEALKGIIGEIDLLNATRNFTHYYYVMQEIILLLFGLLTAFFLFFFSPLGRAIEQILW